MKKITIDHLLDKIKEDGKVVFEIEPTHSWWEREIVFVEPDPDGVIYRRNMLSRENGDWRYSCSGITIDLTPTTLLEWRMRDEDGDWIVKKILPPDTEPIIPKNTLPIKQGIGKYFF